jgi:hypothetical protein
MASHGVRSPQAANAVSMPSNSLAATPPGSRAPAASGSPLVDEQDPLAFVAFVAGKPQAHERFGGGAGAPSRLRYSRTEPQASS